MDRLDETKRSKLDRALDALEMLVSACTTGDRHADGSPAGVRVPDKHVLEQARETLNELGRSR